MLTSAKLRGLYLKGIFSETIYVCVCLHTKVQVSGMILMSFRQGVISSPPQHKMTPKKPTLIRVNKNQRKNF